MDYESMSDFEINKAVAESAFPDDAIITKNVNGYPPKFINDEEGKKAFYEMDKMLNPEKYKDSVINIRSRGMSFVRDFCNNPSDAWPIIVENRISIVDPISLDGLWTAFVFDKDVEPDICHKNPLRAAMIVFLMAAKEQE